MNILICGKNTLYLKNLAERLKREKNEIHYISGSKAAEKAGNFVFQQFDFEYTNPNIGRIVKNTKADVMVLLGATDRNFSWRNPADDAMAFVSGMSSLMMAAKGAGVKKIIFVSSITVVESHTDSLEEGTVSAALSTMNDAIIQVENLCRNITDSHTEAVILRLPGETGYYDINANNDFCLLAAERYMFGSKLSYFPDSVHTIMHYMDAAEAIIKTINYKSEEPKRLFQIQGLVFTEQEYVDALIRTEQHKECTPSPDTTKTVGVTNAAHLETNDEELLGLKLRFGLQEIAEKLCKACLAYKKETEPKKKRRFHILPLIEAFAAAVIVTVISYFLRQTWVGDSFSLFTLYSLLFGAVYGTTYGLLSGVLATIGTLIIQWQDVGLINTIENYSFFLVFLQLILVGVIAGYIHDKYVRKTTTLTEERNYLAQEVNDLTRINDNNIYVKNVYEKRLVGYENSLPRLYELTSQLDFMEPENVIFHANIVAQQLLEVEDVAIYMSSQKSSYFRLNAANSRRATSCGKSFKYDEDCFLYSAFELDEIFKNTKMDPALPSFAGTVRDGDRINAIIMVWTRDIHKVNQYEADMLAIVCRLIEKSMIRANLYDEATRDESYIEGTRIMKEEVFLRRFQNFEEGRQQGVFTYALLRFDSSGDDAIKVQKLLRDTDILGIADNALYIILPFSTADDLQFVTKRFEENGIKIIPAETATLENYIARKMEEEQKAEEA